MTNPADEPGAARRPGRSTSSSSGFDLKELVRTICQLERLSAQRRAERVQRGRQAELLALLSEAAERRSAARRDRPGDRRRRTNFGRHARRHAGRAAARQRLQLVLPDRLRPARGDAAPASASARAKRTSPRACTCSTPSEIQQQARLPTPAAPHKLASDTTAKVRCQNSRVVFDRFRTGAKARGTRPRDCILE